jgi:agmatinase
MSTSTKSRWTLYASQPSHSIEGLTVKVRIDLGFWHVLNLLLVTAEAVFSGITTFNKLPWVQCLGRERDVPFDIAFLGAPFVIFGPFCAPDKNLTLLAGYRNQLPSRGTFWSRSVFLSASFHFHVSVADDDLSLLAGIRAGSRRLNLYGGYNVPLEFNPFKSGLRIVDCGDIPVT